MVPVIWDQQVSCSPNREYGRLSRSPLLVPLSSTLSWVDWHHQSDPVLIWSTLQPASSPCLSPVLVMSDLHPALLLTPFSTSQLHLTSYVVDRMSTLCCDGFNNFTVPQGRSSSWVPLYMGVFHHGLTAHILISRPEFVTFGLEANFDFTISGQWLFS